MRNGPLRLARPAAARRFLRQPAIAARSLRARRPRDRALSGLPALPLRTSRSRSIVCRQTAKARRCFGVVRRRRAINQCGRVPQKRAQVCQKLLVAFARRKPQLDFELSVASFDQLSNALRKRRGRAGRAKTPGPGRAGASPPRSSPKRRDLGARDKIFRRADLKKEDVAPAHQVSAGRARPSRRGSADATPTADYFGDYIGGIHAWPCAETRNGRGEIFQGVSVSQ